MQKHGETLDEEVSFRENTGKQWKNKGKHEKTCKNKGNHWMTKFYFGKTRENIGKTSGKHRENTGKQSKTLGNIG